MSFPDPGGHRKRVTEDEHNTVATSYVEKMMTGLREQAGCEDIAENEQVQAAYSLARHELGTKTRRHAQALDDEKRHAILEQCNMCTL